MKQIAIADGAADVAMLLGALEGHGFDVIAADRHTGLTISNWSQALGGVKITVPKGQAAEASKLLVHLGMPEWRRPRLGVCVLFIFAWWLAYVPPPGLGSTILIRDRRAVGVQITIS